MRTFRFFAAAALLGGFPGGAAAQGFSLDGEVNCAVSAVHRCVGDRCVLRRPQGLEISFDFDRRVACIRRSGSRCEDPRAFRIVDSRLGRHVLFFERTRMLFSIGTQGELEGASLGRGRVDNYMGQCGRG